MIRTLFSRNPRSITPSSYLPQPHIPLRPLLRSSNRFATSSSNPSPPKNAAIPYKTVTVISDTNQNLGLKSLREALKLFDPMTHDLVLVSVSSDDESPQAVCKIISRKEAYDKLRASKLKAKEKPDKQRTDVLKEMEIGSGIGQHDLGIKLKKARDMFGKGYRVQFTLVYRGKETRNNKDVLTDIQAQLADCAALNGEPSVAGKKMIVKFVPTVPKKGAE